MNRSLVTVFLSCNCVTLISLTSFLWDTDKQNTPDVTSLGLSNSFQMGESIIIFRGIRSNFSSFDENHVRIAPDGSPRFAAHIWHYSVYLCPIKRTPGLYGLIFSSVKEAWKELLSRSIGDSL